MMQCFVTPPFVPILITMLIVLGVVVVTWRRREVPGAKPLVVLGVVLMIWLLSYGCEMGSVTTGSAVIWSKLQYIGIVTIPTAWLLIVADVLGKTAWLRPRPLLLLALMPLGTLLVVWTNEWHHLIWDTTTITAYAQFRLLQVTYGPWFWAYWLYAYVCLIFSAGLLVQGFFRSRGLYRRQIGVLLLAAAAPWIGNAVYVTRISPFGLVDLTPFSFTLSSVVVAWALFRLRLIDLVPIARDLVFDSISYRVVVLDLQNRIVDLNAAAANALGVRSVDVLGKSARTAFAAWQQQLERFFTAFDIVEELIVERNGQRYMLEVRISSVYDNYQRLRGRLVVWHDISERKQAEERLQRQNAELAELARENALLYDAAQHELVERRRTEVELYRAKEAAEAANRAKGAFLAHMSHELRTPLTSILGYTQLLRRELQRRRMAEFDPDLQTIEMASHHLLDMITNVLDLSKIEADRMELYLEAFAVAEVMDEVAATVQPLMRKFGNTLRLDIGANPGVIHADRSKVRQILLNLLGNAAKFTRNGSVTCSFAREQEGRSEWAIWRIVDTGVGIALEQQHLLFQAFTQIDPVGSRNYGGTGLGLVISSRFARLMGGEITFNSTPGVGSIFTVRIPTHVEMVLVEPETEQELRTENRELRTKN